MVQSRSKVIADHKCGGVQVRRYGNSGIVFSCLALHSPAQKRNQRNGRLRSRFIAGHRSDSPTLINRVGRGPHAPRVCWLSSKSRFS